jgi:hypothetical protein
MEAVIKKLSEIEIAAKRIMEDASGQLEELKKQMDEKTAAFDIQVEQDTKEQLENLRKTLESQTQEALAKLKGDTKVALSSMEGYYHTNREQLSDTIFKKIIRK